MKCKVLIMAMLMLVVFVAVLSASESRLMALGNAQGFTRDNTDIFTYPGTLNYYLRQANAELRTQGIKSTWTVGANLPISTFGLGIYLNRDTNIDLDGMLDKHTDYYPGDLDISKKIQFLMSLNKNIGFGISMAMDSKSDPTFSDPKKNISMSAMYFGLNGGLSTSRMDVGAYLNIPIAGVSNEVSKEEAALMGVDLGLNGRFFLKDTPRVKYLVLADLGLSSIANVYNTGVANADDETVGEGSFLFDVGLGVNFSPTEKSTLIVGLYPLKIVSNTNITPNTPHPDENDSETFSHIYIPEYKIAFETQLTSWLTGRVGACQDYYFYGHTVEVYDTDAVSNSDYRSNFNAQLGFGINLKRFSIDGVINDAILFDGPDFVGGTGPGMSSKLSIGYDFN